MMPISHMLISALATSILLETAKPALLILGAIAGLLPDIDNASSFTGRFTPWWVWAKLNRNKFYWGVTHSLFATTVIGTFLLAIAYFYPNFLPYAQAITAGYTFGWVADAFTKKGVTMFWPNQIICVCPRDIEYRLSRGSSTEYIVLAVLFVIAVVVFGGYTYLGT